MKLPALLGGPKVEPGGLPVWPPPWSHWSQEKGLNPKTDWPTIETVFNSAAWGVYRGAFHKLLMSNLQTAFGFEYVHTLASGTLAVQVALQAGGVDAGKRVLQSGYDYEANFQTIHALDAKPVLVDHPPIDSHQSTEINNRLPTNLDCQFALLSHLHGAIADISCFRQTGRFIVEDRAQCPGMQTPQCGDMVTLSFGGSKPLTCGRGGAILTNDRWLDQKLRRILRRGNQDWAMLSEVQCYLLLPQITALSAAAGERRERADELLKIADLPRFQASASLGLPDYYKVGFCYDESRWGFGRDVFCAAMRAEGIPISPGFRALHVGRAASRFERMGPTPVAERLHRQCVQLHHPWLLVANMAEKFQEACDKLRAHAGQLAELPKPTGDWAEED